MALDNNIATDVVGRRDEDNPGSSSSANAGDSSSSMNESKENMVFGGGVVS